MKFIVNIPDLTEAINAKSYAQSLQYDLRKRGWRNVTVTTHPYDEPQDLRTELPLPEHDPMDLVKDIDYWPGEDGPRTAYIWFNNGSSACACHKSSADSSTVPSLR